MRGKLRWIRLGAGHSSATKRLYTHPSLCPPPRTPGVPQFLEKLRLTFDVTVEWSSFDEAELASLLKASHIGEEQKPLQLLRAVRVR